MSEKHNDFTLADLKMSLLRMELEHACSPYVIKEHLMKAHYHLQSLIQNLEMTKPLMAVCSNMASIDSDLEIKFL